MVVPTPFHKPLTPVSLLIVATSFQNPPMTPPPASSRGKTSVADPFDIPPRANICSRVTVSPHIPVHFEGCKQPEGGATGVRADLKEANEVPLFASVVVAGVATLKQVSGLFGENRVLVVLTVLGVNTEV